MTSTSVEESLDRAEAATSAGAGLSGTGFWSAVATVKRNPELVDRHADRIAAIDEAAFRQWVLLTVPLGLGTALAVTALVVGIFLIGLAYALDGFPAVLVFFAGFVAVIGSTHGLAHLVVGWAVGIRFTCWFIARVTQPQPGVKVDYASYLRTAPQKRAWMHASGAIVTKAIPFMLIGAALAANLPTWAVWLLLVIGIVVLLADLVWSTKKSDWKKFQREMSFAQGS
ncbi:MAG TPA: hypothetical protein VFZ80_01710 [Acidimicrobiia bacterium]